MCDAVVVVEGLDLLDELGGLVVEHLEVVQVGLVVEADFEHVV